MITEDNDTNLGIPRSGAESQRSSKLSRRTTSTMSQDTVEPIRQMKEELSSELDEKFEKFHQSFNQQRQEILAEEAKKEKEFNSFHNSSQRPGFLVTKIVDQVPFNFKAKAFYEHPNNFSVNLGTNLLDANFNVPFREKNEQKRGQPQEIQK